MSPRLDVAVTLAIIAAIACLLSIAYHAARIVLNLGMHDRCCPCRTCWDDDVSEALAVANGEPESDEAFLRRHGIHP